MTRPRATTSPSDALGATIADLKARLARLENIAHQHNTPASGFVRRAGDTMTGELILPGDPVNNLGAATKQYADSKVAKAGDTMTGELILPGNPVNNLGAATKQYADGKVAKTGDTMTGTLDLRDRLLLKTGNTVGAQVYGYSISQTASGWRDFGTYTLNVNNTHAFLSVLSFSNSGGNLGVISCSIQLRSFAMPSTDQNLFQNYQSGNLTQQVGLRVLSASSSSVSWRLAMRVTAGSPQSRGVIVQVMERADFQGFTPITNFPAGTTPTITVG